MLGGKSWDEWIKDYSGSHQHPINRFCHTLGIPMIALSLPLFLVAIVVHGFWPVPTALFVVGWIFQFVGHAIEGLHDPQKQACADKNSPRNLRAHTRRSRRFHRCCSGWSKEFPKSFL